MKSLNKKLKGCLIIIILLISAIFGCTDDSSRTDTKKTNLGWNKQIAVAYVHSFAVAIGQAVLKMNQDSTIIDYIRKATDSVRFYPDSSGYFYVYNYDCVNIAHASQKDLQGKNLYEYKDSHQEYVIRNLAAKAKNGGGFVEFYWIKPGETGEKKKIGYVEPIPNTNYFIGSGVYLE